MPNQEPPLGAKLIDLGHVLAEAQYRIVHAAAAFYGGNEWHRVAPTAAHWIAEKLDVHVGTAREWIRIGRMLAELPLIERAFADRKISYSKVRTLSRIATPENEAELLPIAEGVPASRLGCALAEWSNRAEDPNIIDQRHQRDRRLRWWVEPDGMVAGFFRLPPAGAAILTASLDEVVKRLAALPRHGASADASGWPSLAQQRADALVGLASQGGASIDSEIVIHVRGDGCSLDDGTPITETVVERLAPRSLLRALIHDAAGRPVNASSRRRHPDARQKRVIKERDRRCVDCGSNDLLEFDHVPGFDSSGRTIVDEIELRCAPCHQRRHRKAA